MVCLHHACYDDTVACIDWSGRSVRFFLTPNQWSPSHIITSSQVSGGWSVEVLLSIQDGIRLNHSSLVACCEPLKWLPQTLDGLVPSKRLPDLSFLCFFRFYFLGKTATLPRHRRFEWLFNSSPKPLKPDLWTGNFSQPNGDISRPWFMDVHGMHLCEYVFPHQTSIDSSFWLDKGHLVLYGQTQNTIWLSKHIILRFDNHKQWAYQYHSVYDRDMIDSENWWETCPEHTNHIQSYHKCSLLTLVTSAYPALTLNHLISSDIISYKISPKKTTSHC